MCVYNLLTNTVIGRCIGSTSNCLDGQIGRPNEHADRVDRLLGRAAVEWFELPIAAIDYGDYQVVIRLLKLQTLKNFNEC